ncbi:hypothetical protein IW262DRAFT_1531425 [Armillaria fumosa]|nr:hypothetical protein IW262DRAFT_1531425 [Armillaria fumosa]
MDYMQHSLFTHVQGMAYPYKLVPEMALELGRLLRFYSDLHFPGDFSFIATPEFDSFELTVAILSNGYRLSNSKTESVGPGTFFIDIIRSSKLPPHCWYHLMIQSEDVLGPIDPDNDDDTNWFPLHLCSAILASLCRSEKGLTQDFNSLLVVDFKQALPDFLDKIYDLVFHMFSNFVKDPSLAEPLLPQSLRVFVVAIKFMLHRLSLPDSDVSHPMIYQSLGTALSWIHGETFSLQEATAVMMVLDDISGVVPLLYSTSDWIGLCNNAILTYPSLTTIAPSGCSLHGLQSMVDFMESQWDQTTDPCFLETIHSMKLQFLWTSQDWCSYVHKMLPGMNAGGNFMIWYKRVWRDFDDESHSANESHPNNNSCPLQPNEIQVEKDNIRYVIYVLDDFFDSRAHTIMGYVDHFLGRYFGQKLEDKQEQKQQV